MIPLSAVKIFAILLWIQSNVAGAENTSPLSATEEVEELFQNSVSANTFIQCIQSHSSYNLLPHEENYLNSLGDLLRSFVPEDGENVTTKFKAQILQAKLAYFAADIFSNNFPRTLHNVYDVLIDCIVQNTGRSTSKFAANIRALISTLETGIDNPGTKKTSDLSQTAKNEFLKAESNQNSSSIEKLSEQKVSSYRISGQSQELQNQEEFKISNIENNFTNVLETTQVGDIVLSSSKPFNSENSFEVPYVNMTKNSPKLTTMKHNEFYRQSTVPFAFGNTFLAGQNKFKETTMPIFDSSNSGITSLPSAKKPTSSLLLSNTVQENSPKLQSSILMQNAHEQFALQTMPKQEFVQNSNMRNGRLYDSSNGLLISRTNQTSFLGFPNLFAATSPKLKVNKSATSSEDQQPIVQNSYVGKRRLFDSSKDSSFTSRTNQTSFRGFPNLFATASPKLKSNKSGILSEDQQKESMNNAPQSIVSSSNSDFGSFTSAQRNASSEISSNVVETHLPKFSLQNIKQETENNDYYAKTDSRSKFNKVSTPISFKNRETRIPTLYKSYSVIQNSTQFVLPNGTENKYIVSLLNPNSSANAIISRFSSNFLQAIASSSLLTRAYDTSLDASVVSEAYFNAVLHFLQKTGIPNAKSLANTMSRVIQNTFKNLTPSKYIAAFGKAIGSYMYLLGLLEFENSKPLSRDFVKSMNDAISKMPAKRNREEAYVEALWNGVANYLKTLDMLTPETMPLLISSFSNALNYWARLSSSNESAKGSAFDDPFILTENSKNVFSDLPRAKTIQEMQIRESPLSPLNIGSKGLDKGKSYLDLSTALSASVPNSKSQIISLFASNFLQYINSSPFLLNIDDTFIDPLQAGKAYYKATLKSFRKVGLPNPKSLARNVEETVLETFNKLTSTQRMQAFSFAFGKYLYRLGILNQENVCKLSDVFIGYVRKAVHDFSLSTKDRMNYFIQAVFKGLKNFQTVLGIFYPRVLLNWISYFSDALYTLAKFPQTRLFSLNLKCENAISETGNKPKNMSCCKLNSGNINSKRISRISQQRNFDYESKDSSETIKFLNEKDTARHSNPVSLFSADFLKQVNTSRTLEKAFDSAARAPSRVYFNVTYDYGIQMDATDPTCIANMVSETIASLTGYLSASDIAYATSLAVGQYLDREKIMNVENYSSFSHEFATAINSALRNREVKNSEKLSIIFEGIINFLKRFGIVKSSSPPCLVSYFVGALKSVVGKQRDYFGDQDFLRKNGNKLYRDSDDKLLTISPAQENASEKPKTNTSFSEYVLNQISSSEILSEHFELNMTTREIADAFYNFFYKHRNFITDQPEKDAQVVYDTLMSTTDWLKPFPYIELVVKSLEDFLYQHFTLKPENTVDLAHKYLKALKQAADFAETYKHKQSFADILLMATYNFITTLLVSDNPMSWTSLFFSELATYRDISLPMLISDIAPEVLSTRGLFSKTAASRINNLATSVAKDLLSGKGNIQISAFMSNLMSLASQIKQNSTGSKPINVLIETLLEGTLALISVVNATVISSKYVPEQK